MKRIWLVLKREEKCLTHEEVASRADIQRQYYGMIENGTRNPSVEVAKRISNVLEFEWTIFFENKSNETLRGEAL